MAVLAQTESVTVACAAMGGGPGGWHGALGSIALVATLKDREVREQVAARGRLETPSRTADEEAAAARLRESFACFDGTDTAYIRFLTGVSEEDMRRVGAI